MRGDLEPQDLGHFSFTGILQGIASSLQKTNTFLNMLALSVHGKLPCTLGDHWRNSPTLSAFSSKTFAWSTPTRSDATPPHPLGEQALATPNTPHHARQEAFIVVPDVAAWPRTIRLRLVGVLQVLVAMLITPYSLLTVPPWWQSPPCDLCHRQYNKVRVHAFTACDRCCCPLFTRA